MTQEPADSRISLPLQLSLWLMLGSSFFVMREPAPTDLFFPLFAAAVVLGGHSLGPLNFPIPLLIASVGVLATNLVGLFWSYSFTVSLRYAAITLYLFAFCLMFAGTIGKHGRRLADQAVSAMLLAAGIASAIGILARFHLLPNSEMFFRDDSGMRVKSTFKDPNVFAPFVVGAALILLARIVESRKIRLVHVLLLGAYTAAILLAFSRGAWAHFLLSLALFAGMHVVIIRDPQTLKRLLFTAAAGACSIVPGVGILMARPELGGYFLERLSLQSYDNDRFGNQDQALFTAMENPLGLGPGMWDLPFEMATHNVYVRLLVENGVAGLLSVLLFAGVACFAAWRLVLNRGQSANLAAACLAVSVGILAESIIIDTLHWRHLFFYLAVPLGLLMNERSSDATIRSMGTRQWDDPGIAA